MRRRRTAIVGVLFVSLFGTSCSGDDTTPLDGRIDFAALLADGTLVGYTADGDEIARVRIGRQLQSPVSGQYIGVVRAVPRGELVVIDAAASPNELVFVDSESWKIERRMDLPRRSLFRNITVGRQARRFYVAGDTPTELVSPFGSIANAATIAVLDGKGRVIAAKTVRSPRLTAGKVAPYDWSVYSIAMNEKSQTIYVSYHGPNTSGADSVKIRGRRLIRCAPSGEGGVACLRPVHGRIQSFRSGLLATRGTPPTLVLLRAGGTVEAEWESGFRSAHLMEFARAGSRVFGLESCPKLGGLTAVDLDRKVARMLARPAAPGTTRPRGVCGEGIAARPSDLRLAVAKSVEGLSHVLFIDGRTGRVVATRRVTATPIDVAAVP